MKSCRITDYCYVNNPLNFASDPTHNGRLATGLDFVRIYFIYFFNYSFICKNHVMRYR